MLTQIFPFKCSYVFRQRMPYRYQSAQPILQEWCGDKCIYCRPQGGNAKIQFTTHDPACDAFRYVFQNVDLDLRCFDGKIRYGVR
ncbi:hypothetical protein AFEL58S_02924 [Afipia felis]